MTEAWFRHACSRRALVRLLMPAVAAGLAAGPAGAQDQDAPRFTTSVEVMSVDVAVVDAKGVPVEGLQPSDFQVRVDNVPRRVLSAEWVPLGIGGGGAPEPPPPGYSSNAEAEAGRLLVIVVDQPNIRFGSTSALRGAVDLLIDRLHPSDRLAIVGLGLGSRSMPFTADRDRARRAVRVLTGQRQPFEDFRHHLPLSEAMDIYNGNPVALHAAVNRECSSYEDALLQNCVKSIESAAIVMAQQVQANNQQTLLGLRSVLTSLRLVDAPKTLLFVSEGFLIADEVHTLMNLGSLAAEARTTIFTLRLEHDPFDAAAGRMMGAVLEERRRLSESLEVMADAARGSMFDISAGAGAALTRIESETSGYYLLGVESPPLVSGARRHAVRVDVPRRGVTVRWRREVLGLGGRAPAANPRQAVVDALRAPLLVSALPLRATAFSLSDPDPGKVQVLLHADVGEEYSSGRVVQIGYTIVDGEGRVVESQTGAARLEPVMNGVPSPLQFRAGASLPPGEYIAKLAVAEGDRVGSIEHVVRAGLVPAGPLNLSELIVGGPAFVRDALQPTVGHTVSFGLLHAFMEAYGPEAADLQVTYEVAREEDGPAMLAEQAPARRVGNARAIFTHLLRVQQLPSGSYVLRAAISRSGETAPFKTVARPFDIATPAVLMSSAERSGAPVAANELFLPVQEQLLAPAFNAEEPARPEILSVFRARIDEPARQAFEAGVAAYAGADYRKAEDSFKSAIQIDGASAAALAYLAATFAAAGHDDQAAGAWQTALIEGADLPQIYAWLADALMRKRDFVQARAILDEAVAAWPSDPRFAKPLAILYATFGLGREAVRTMERHLQHTSDDLEALSLAVEWIYHLHASGAVARTRADDLQNARTYAETYTRAGGPATPLVQEWIRALEEGRR